MTNQNSLPIMFLDVRRVLGLPIMGTILFCSAFFTSLVYFDIKEVYHGVLLAKIISLVALAGFGQSEALTFYLKHHSAAKVSVVSLLNKVGIILTFLCLFTVALNLLILKKVIASGNDELESILYYSEVFAFLPIIFFAAIDVLMWWSLEERREIGRVCFVIADLPVLMPIAIIFIFAVILKMYGKDEFHLFIGGATVMFILVSIFLSECTRSLLDGFSPTPSSPGSDNP